MDAVWQQHTGVGSSAQLRLGLRMQLGKQILELRARGKKLDAHQKNRFDRALFRELERRFIASLPQEIATHIFLN